MKNIQVRVNDELKDQVDNIFEKLGLSTNDAIKIFLKACQNKHGFPFALRLPEPETLADYVANKMLPISDSEFREILDFLMISGEFTKEPEFEGVFHEKVNINGLTSEDEEATLAEADILLVDTTKEDLFDVADAISGDLMVVGSALEKERNEATQYTRVAILDEFFVFVRSANAVDRIRLLQSTFDYLSDRGVTIIGFCNAGLWRTESVEEQKALSQALTNSSFDKIQSAKNWNSNVNAKMVGLENED